MDLADMLISLYRTNFRSKRWYLKVLFHCVDIAKVNAWILYRRHASQLKTKKKKQDSLLTFTTKISHALIRSQSCGKPNTPGRPPKRKSLDAENSTPPSKRPLQQTALLTDDERYDGIGHWPEYREKKNKCKYCNGGQSRLQKVS